VGGGHQAGVDEDAGTDDHADPEDGEVERTEVLLQAVLGLLRLGDRLLD
jgi:hypothetical protein